MAQCENYATINCVCACACMKLCILHWYKRPLNWNLIHILSVFILCERTNENKAIVFSLFQLDWEFMLLFVIQANQDRRGRARERKRIVLKIHWLNLKCNALIVHEAGITKAKSNQKRVYVGLKLISRSRCLCILCARPSGAVFSVFISFSRYCLVQLVSPFSWCHCWKKLKNV